MKEFLRGGGWIASIFCFLIVGVVCAEPEFYTPDRDKFDPEKDKIEDKAGLPQILLIGDSIMGGYYKQVAKELEKEANVHRHPGNAGDTVNGLRYIDEWLGDTKWGVIHFNWGLHDLCYRHPESKEQGKRDKERGKISVPLEDYSKNLEQLVIRLQKTGAKLIFATITKVPEGEVGRFEGDELKYNAAALEIMKKYKIPVNDLHAVSAKFDADGFSKPADVHFSGKGNGELSKQVVSVIRTIGLGVESE